MKIFEVSKIKDYLEYLRFVLLHCVQFIWYDASLAVSSSNEKKVFANFNTGKLPLTNSELIKAIFMNPAYFGEEISGINKIKDRQINISESWDRMETLLNDPEFWAFVPHPNQYHSLMNDKVTEKYEETRIDVIFDFLVRKKFISQSSFINDEYSTFIAIEKWILEKIEGKENKRETMDECWNEIKKIFSYLQELYEDKENNGKLYNLLGVYIYISNLRKPDGTYYVSLKSNNVVYNVESDIYLEIFDFLCEVSQTPRDRRIVKVKKKLKDMIFGTCDVQKNIISIRCYGTDDDKITLSLLLFNILKLNQSDGAGNRFKFSEFAKNTWQREHIFATENEGVPVEPLYRQSILQGITQALEDFDDVKMLKENPYIKYWNFIERGDEFSFPNKDEDVWKGDFERKIKFLKASSEILLRYELLDNSKKLLI